MIQCGAIVARTGHLNASIAKRLEARGRVSGLTTLLRSAPTDQARYVQVARFSASRLPVRYFHFSYSRSLCLRKLDSQLQTRLCSSCSTDVRQQPAVSRIPKDDNALDQAKPTDGTSQQSSHSAINLKNVFNDVHKGGEHRTHPRHHVETKLPEIEKLYPNAKGKLNDIYVSVSGQLKQPKALSVEFVAPSKQRRLWTCHYRLKWPETQTITVTSSHKSGAAKLGALKCLQWLHNAGKLRNGQPIVIESKAVTEMLRRPTPIAVSEESLENVKHLLERYKNGVRDRMTDNRKSENLRDVASVNENPAHPVGLFYENEWKSTSKRANRDDVLRLRHGDRANFRTKMTMENGRELPIAEYREEIVRAIDDNRVLLIRGDTGCGKTTQVPQYIMETYEAQGRGTDCNMIISQPRRISAISLAERIAQERSERVGHVVGYQVRLQQKLATSPGAMLFCTSGILLRKIQSNPGLLGCSHVILDEAHERSINTDMLLVLLKRALDANPKLRLVVMSATINADLFQSYFGCPAVQIPGRTFPVESKFLEDVERLGMRSQREYVGDREFPDVPFVDCDLIARLVDYIDQRRPAGAILVFLPGWAEITKVKRALEENRGKASRRLIVPVHSRMPHRDQRRIFERAPEGVRKIVLATDIAETGITVTDVVYVVDSATQKAMRWHEKKGLASMENQYAAQANILQRKGRAGRVQPGESYHLVTRAHFENLEPDPLPEVLRSSLEKTVLDCKTYSNESAENFLGSMPQPPTLSAVRKAIQDLRELGALDDDENLTALGRRIALFTVHPKLSKALVCSAIFRCVSPMVTVATSMSAENEIFTGTLYDKVAIRNIKQKYHPASDHLSIHWLYSQWASHNKQDRSAANEFCWSKKLVPERVYTLSKVRDLNAEGLVQCRMLNSLDDYDRPGSRVNEYSDLDELVRGVLLAGLDQLLYRRDFELRGHKVKKGTSSFIMEDGNRATLTPETVNFKRAQWPSAFLTYVRRQHSEERRTSLIRETSMVSPLTVLLFSQGRVQGYQQTNDEGSPSSTVLLTIKGRKNFRLSCDRSVANVLLEFRDSIWSVVRYLVERQGLVEVGGPGTDFHEVDNYKEHMLQVLTKMLAEASEKIDQPDSTSAKKSEDTDDEELSD